MSGIKGRPTSKKLQSATNDLREQDNFVTVLPIGSSRHAIDTIPMGYYSVQSSVSAGASSTDEILNLTAHGAKRGDILRIESSLNSIEEFEVAIKEIIDANNVRLASILSAPLSSGDTVSILRPIAQRMDATGASLASVVSPPIQIIKDGNTETVTKDTAVPSNTVAIPVEIVSGSGTEITITAGDINVQLSHLGPNADSTRIGDGTNLMAVNSSLEAQVRDDDANATLLVMASDIQKIASAVDTNGTTHSAEGFMVLGSDGTNSVRLKLDADGHQQVDILSQALPTGAATEAAQNTGNASLSTIASNTAGLATQATLAAIDAKLPATLGEKADTASLAVTLSTENEQILANSLTALQIIDNIVSGSEAQVDIVDAGPLLTQTQFNTLTGAVNETAPANDTASSGLNGRLQRIAQRLTSLIGLLPAALGQQNMAGSLSVAIASNQSVIPVSQSRVMHSAVNFSAAGNLTAPSGAKGFTIQNSLLADSNLRFAPGAGVASSTVGYYVGIGQSTSYQDGAPSVISIGNVDGGTIDGCIIWYV